MKGNGVAMLIGAGRFKQAMRLSRQPKLSMRRGQGAIGQAALPDHLPFVTGSIGLLAPSRHGKMMQDCDTLLMVGSGFPISDSFPRRDGPVGVQIDIESRMLICRYPMEWPACDSRLTLEPASDAAGKEDRSGERRLKSG